MTNDVCTAKVDFEGVLSVGTPYRILRQTEQSVWIEDDEGNITWYGRIHFFNSGYEL